MEIILLYKFLTVYLTNQALPALRALAAIYGPISVVHFDSHLDTFVPRHFELITVGHQEHILQFGLVPNLTLLTAQCSGEDFSKYHLTVGWLTKKAL